MSNLETMKAVYAAFARNDPSVLFGSMAPDIRWHQAQGNPLADRNPYIGPQAIGEGVFGRLLSAIDNFTVTPETYVADGDYVVAVGRYSGVAKTSGAILDTPFCHVWRFSDGKIATFNQFTDTAQWARLMG